MNWAEFLNYLRSNKKAILAGLLEKSQQRWSDSNNLTLVTKDSYFASELKKNIGAIEVELQKFSNKKVKLRIGQVDKEGKDLSSTTPLGSFITNYDRLIETANLDKKLTFEMFATSLSNAIAHAAAQKISKEPGKVYNPLFLYGTTGVGKTHLSEAVAIEFLKNNPSARVKYFTSEEFVNDVIEAIKTSKTSNFRKNCRNLDMIIIDDIQFLSAKNSCQEELFHLFNSVISQGKQIIITSDIPPQELKGFADRLRSRFSQGLIIKIDDPDFELRYAILLIKSKEIGVNISPEKMNEIAEKSINTREMIGVLHSFHAQTLLSPDQNYALNTKNDIMTYPSSFIQNQKNLNTSQIMKVVCLHFGVKVGELKSDSRVSSLNEARQICMYIMKEFTNKTLVEIALTLNKKDHTTIMHGINKIKKRIISTPSFNDQINRLVGEIRRG